MDCFFASVALRDRPHLRSMPVGVCHGVDSTTTPMPFSSGGKQSSDVASCNYIARSFGVRNGMSVGRAKSLCPQVRPLNFTL
jgi:DNA repair protein REV1